MASLEKNPAAPMGVNGMPSPVMAMVPISIISQVYGMCFISPPILRMSCS